MLLFLYTNWWTNLSIADQMLGSLVVITTVLLIIFEVFIRLQPDELPTTEKKHVFDDWFTPRRILHFLTACSWGALIGFQISSNPVWYITISLLSGIFIVILPFTRFGNITRKHLKKIDEKEQILESIGKVAVKVPPHRNGFGIVRVKAQKGPYELEAITAGDELQTGSPIRIVDVIDERIVLVERVTNQQRDIDGLPDLPPGASGPQ
ncbi:MAG: hypothetical protein MRY78_09170 [Saprospiraceae bacterium]|nr:hypothetical protein [Saprospiraceae bacterium]